MTPLRPLDRHIRADLNRRLTLIGTQLGADLVTIVSPILPGLAKVNEATVAAHERLEQELKKLGVDTTPRFGIEPPLGRAAPDSPTGTASVRARRHER